MDHTPADNPAPTPLDLNSFQDLDQAELQLRNPLTGKPIAGAVVLLAGPEHPRRRAMTFERSRRLRKELAERGSIDPADPATEYAEETAMLAACTLGWRGLTRGGAPVAHSEGVAQQLYADPKLRWLRDQVRAGLERRELFIGSSAPA